MNPQEHDGFLTPEELVARWRGKVTTGTLANWRAHKPRHKGPGYTKIGSAVLYPLDEVEAYEAKHLHPANDNKPQ